MRRVYLGCVPSLVFIGGGGVCDILLFSRFVRCFDGMYCCEFGVYILFCNGVIIKYSLF